MGNVTRYEYDSRGRLVKTIDALGSENRIVYGPRGEVLASIDALGYRTLFGYDALGRKILELEEATGARTGDAITQSFRYRDLPSGREVTITNGLGARTKQSFDFRGLVVASLDATNRKTEYRYDLNGNRIATIAPDGVENLVGFDAVNRRQSTTDAELRTITYFYDAAGRNTGYRDARGFDYQFTYDHKGRRTSRVEPDGSSTQYRYDLAGNLIAKIKADGEVAEYQHDEMGRVLTISWTQEGTADTVYSYDERGRWLTVQHGQSLVQRSYDEAGRTLSETQTFEGLRQVVGYGYDVDGLMNLMTRPDGTTVNYRYGASQKLAAVSLGDGSPIANYTRDGRGQIVGLNLGGDAVSTTKRYDAAGRVEQITHRSGQTVHEEIKYRHDAAGQRITLTWADGSEDRFRYDKARQVVSAEIAASAGDTSYVYDPAGNRESWQTGGAAPITYQTNELNQYTQVGAVEQSHDLNGNLLVDGKREYFWNANNRLVGWKSHDGQSQAWKSYDGLGRLISETMQVGEEVTKSDFAYDGWNQIQETTDQGNGQVQSENFIWGEDLSGTLQRAGGVGGLLARQSSEDGTSFYQMDGNGNVLGLTDSQGNSQAKYRYDAFGNKVWENSQLVCANQFCFSTKRANSESGLLYFGYRYYDPVTGRWPSNDPIEERGGVNLYAYIENKINLSFDYLGLVMASAQVGTAATPVPDGFYGGKSAKIVYNSKWFDIPTCAGRKLKIEGAPEIQIGIVQSYFEEGSNTSQLRDGAGNDVYAHEQVHEAVFVGQWNAAADFANPFNNRTFSSICCCDKWESYVSRHLLYKQRTMEALQKIFDESVFPGATNGSIQDYLDVIEYYDTLKERTNAPTCN